MVRALLAARGNYEGGDMSAFVARDLAFHKAVIAASGNRAMIGIYDFFSTSITETIEATLGKRPSRAGHEGHADIVDAIETGDQRRRSARFMAPVLQHLTGCLPHECPALPRQPDAGRYRRDRDQLGTAASAWPPSTATRVLLGISLVLIAFNLRAGLFQRLGAPARKSARNLRFPHRHKPAHHPAGRLPWRLFALCAATLRGRAHAAQKRDLPAGTRHGAARLFLHSGALSRHDDCRRLHRRRQRAAAGLVKRDFADRAALMTGAYTMALCAGATTRPA